MMDKDLEVYKAVFETWRYEVNSYWQRNSYFAAFETAALAGCWYVIEHGNPWAGLAFSIIGLTSVIAWFITSLAVHKYTRYWWESIKKVENGLSLKDIGFDFATKHPGSGMHPSFWVHVIPVLFGVAWFVIFVVAIRGTCPCSGH